MTIKKSKRPAGWHMADIKARLAKKGYSFARIAREYGYADRSPNTVLWRPWSTMEQIVAEIVEVKPQTIWPGRYDKAGHHLGTLKTIAKGKSRVNG